MSIQTGGCGRIRRKQGAMYNISVNNKKLRRAG